MAGKNDKGAFYSVSVPAKTVSSFFRSDPGNQHYCAGSIVRGLSECWATKTADPLTSFTADLVFGSQGSEVVVVPVSLKDTMRDYLLGAGSAMNPLQHENAHFYTSDLDAMASDWNSTISDMYTILKTADVIKASKYEQLTDGQPIGRSERATESEKIGRDRFKAGT